MARRIELVEASATAGRTIYCVLADGQRVGTAELAHDAAAPWRLTVPGHCDNLRRSSRETVLATVTWLLDPSSRRTVVHVPSDPGSREVAAELRAAGFEVRPMPMPESGHAIPAPVILCTREI